MDDMDDMDDMDGMVTNFHCETSLKRNITRGTHSIVRSLSFLDNLVL